MLRCLSSARFFLGSLPVPRCFALALTSSNAAHSASSCCSAGVGARSAAAGGCASTPTCYGSEGGGPGTTANPCRMGVASTQVLGDGLWSVRIYVLHL